MKNIIIVTFKCDLRDLITYFVFQGLRNDFKAAMEKIDQEYLAELIEHQVTINCFVSVVVLSLSQS